MKELITKSLFNEIYNCDIFKDDDMLRYYNRINIYEFAFKCKVWVFNKYKIYLSSELGEDSEISLFLDC